MGYKSKLIKIALNKSPTRMVLWLVNKKLKGIAELTDFSFDSDEEKIYTNVLLAGEEEPFEVWLEDFTLVSEDEASYKLIIHQARSSREWLNALLTQLILEREWKIPESKIELVREFFESEDDNNEV